MNLQLPTLHEVKMEKLKRSHLNFMSFTWRSREEFLVGFHTREISKAIDKAMDRYRQGISSFIQIKVHPRAGKSDIVSRYLPPNFIGQFPDAEIMDVSYSKGKAQGFSRFGMQIVQSNKYKEIFPNVRLDKDAAGDWNVKEVLPDGSFKQRLGRVYACGLLAGLTGNGYNLGVLDDFCGSRQSAESPVQRETMWEAFTNDFMTRRAPVSITIVLATQWHEDDIHGRIENRNNPNHEDYDPAFPVFERYSFPARRELYHTPDDYPNEYLFMERYSKEWYESQYATLAPYAASALFDCAATPRKGAILNIEQIKWYNSTTEKDREWPDNLRWMRVWDLAHTEKQRTSDDPDYTGGTLLAYNKIGQNSLNQPLYDLYIKHYDQFRLNPPERDNKIIRYSVEDKGALVVVENSLDSKDAGAYLKKRLQGIKTVKVVDCKGDKVQRCAPIEPLFEFGHVHVLRGPWNNVWLDGIKKFNGTGKTHDEMVDNITCGYQASSKGGYGNSKVKWG